MSATVLDYLFVFIMYGQIRIAMNTICVQWQGVISICCMRLS